MFEAPPTRQEIGGRFRWLRQASGLPGRRVAALIGDTSSAITTKMEKGESLTVERLAATSLALAGQGQLVEDPKALFDFMVWGGEVADVLHPQLRPVEVASRPELEVLEDPKSKANRRPSTKRGRAANGYIRHRAPHQGQRIHSLPTPRRNARKVA